MELLKDVLKEIKPSNEKEVLNDVDATIKAINSALKKQKINAKAVSGGSIAKNTWIKGDHDCDIFVKFDYNKYLNADISQILENALRNVFQNVISLHGSRDYFQMKGKINYEIVPVLNVKDPKKAMNVTDCSVLHVEWVNKFPKMTDDIRLTKAFCKSMGAYGAESYIKGFSGHVIDILTIYYKGFLNLLRGSKKWKEHSVIDFYNLHKGNALHNLNKSKISPLIVIDPIQTSRNAAAALSIEKFLLFKKKAAEFLKKPSKEFFERKELDLNELKKKAKNDTLIILEVSALSGKEDIVGAKLLKALEHIVQELKHNEFILKQHGWKWDRNEKAVFWFITDKKELKKTFVREGPIIKDQIHCAAFRKIHPNAFEKGKRMYAEIKRPFTLPEELIKDLIKQEYVKERVKDIRIK